MGIRGILMKWSWDFDGFCLCVCVFYMGFKWNFGHWSVSQYVPVQFYVVEPHDVYLISTASDLPASFIFCH